MFQQVASTATISKKGRLSGVQQSNRGIGIGRSVGQHRQLRLRNSEGGDFSFDSDLVRETGAKRIEEFQAALKEPKNALQALPTKLVSQVRGLDEELKPFGYHMRSFLPISSRTVFEDWELK